MQYVIAYLERKSLCSEVNRMLHENGETVQFKPTSDIRMMRGTRDLLYAQGRNNALFSSSKNVMQEVVNRYVRIAPRLPKVLQINTNGLSKRVADELADKTFDEPLRAISKSFGDRFGSVMNPWVMLGGMVTLIALNNSSEQNEFEEEKLQHKEEYERVLREEASQRFLILSRDEREDLFKKAAIEYIEGAARARNIPLDDFVRGTQPVHVPPTDLMKPPSDTAGDTSVQSEEGDGDADDDKETVISLEMSPRCHTPAQDAIDRALANAEPENA